MKPLSAEQRAFAEKAVSQYQSDLRTDTAVQAYLTTRGISPEVAGRFRLGAVTSPPAGHEQFRGRLALPYLTPAGPVGFNFRCVQSHDCKELGHPKYLKPSGQESHLFNVTALKTDSAHVVVSEGEIDTITWDMCGVPAVGLAGVKSWKKHFRYCLDDFDVVYCAADGDEAGDGLASLLAKEVNARPIRFPKGSDANALYVRAGADAVRGLLG